MTNICPMPTMTKKVENDSAAATSWPAPWPAAKTMAASHVASAPAKDQIHGFSNRVRRVNPWLSLMPRPSG